MYAALPVFMVLQQTEKLGYYSRWKKKYATRQWEQNSGSLMQGILAERAPKVRQSFAPTVLANPALVNVVSYKERVNTANLKHAKWESPVFNWLPSFTDFRTGQLDHANEVLTDQIAMGFDDFVRWQIFNQSPHVYVVGAATEYVTGIPVGEATDSADPKDTGFRQAMGASVGNNGFLNYLNLVNAVTYARTYAGITPWTMMKGAPAENETVRGKFIVTGEAAIYEQLTFDSHVLNTRPLQTDLLTKTFKGVINENIVFQEERYPLFIDKDGNLPSPEVELINPALSPAAVGGPAQNVEVVPNAAYFGAPTGVAFLEGYQAYEAINVGAPPSEYAGGKITGKQFRRFQGLSWNGDVRITDDIITIDSAGRPQPNIYGEYLKLYAYTVLGIIANTPRNVMPIFYRRRLKIDPTIV